MRARCPHVWAWAVLPQLRIAQLEENAVLLFSERLSCLCVALRAVRFGAHLGHMPGANCVLARHQDLVNSMFLC